LGTILLQENSLEDASSFFRNVIAANPRHTGALINLGLVAKREKRFDEAVSSFKMAIQEDPCSVEGLSNLGYLLYHSGDLAGAENAFERLSRIAPGLRDPLLLLSRIHVEQGRFDRAVKDCDALLRLLKLGTNVILNSLGDLADLYLSIGETLIQNGQMNPAHWAFETALLLSENAPSMFERILSLYPNAGQFRKVAEAGCLIPDAGCWMPDKTARA
jgi:tetratricopeptide (TPR) repeat protein